MNNSKKDFRYNLTFGVTKGFLVYLLYGLFTLPSSMLIRNRYFEKRYVQGFWNEELYCISSFLFSLIFFFSLASIFTLYDKQYKEDFGAWDNVNVGFLSKCNFILTSRTFWIESATLFVLIAIFPYLSPFSEFLYAFFGKTELIRGNLIIAAFMIPLLFLINFIAKMSTVNWWQRLRIKKALHKEKRTVLKMIVQIGYTAAIYLVTATTLSIVIPMLYTMLSLVKFILIGFFSVVILLIALIPIIKYGRAIILRKKMMKKLKKLCDAYRYRISDIIAIYKSVIFNTDGVNFVISTDKDVYACKLICCTKKGLYFRECGEAYYNNDFLGILKHTTSFNYSFEARSRLGQEMKKILIIAPDVARIFVTDDVTDRRVYSGDAVMGYQVYQSSEFLGFVDRRCL